MSPTSGMPSAADKIRQASAEMLSSSSVFFDDMRSALDIRAQLQKRTFYPLTGSTLTDLIAERQWGHEYHSPEDWKAAIINYVEGSDLRHAIVTADGRALDALWVPSSGRRRGLTAVLFHANAMVGLDMFNYAEWYRQRGLDVLVVTMGGYGDSTGVPGELSSYQDAVAAIDYCIKNKQIPPHRILLHGLSLGGALAAAGSLCFPGVHAVLDQTFTSALAVARSVISKQATWVPGFVVEQAVSAMFPVGQEACESCPGVLTDGYDTVGKVARMQGQLFVISASEDDMMPLEFAEQLVQARYKLMESRKKARLAVLRGAHCTMFDTDPAAAAALVHFLDDLVGAAHNTEMDIGEALPEWEHPGALGGSQGEARVRSELRETVVSVPSMPKLETGEPTSSDPLEQMAERAKAGGTATDGKWNI